MEFQIQEIDFSKKKHSQSRVMICQLNYKDFDWEYNSGLYFLKYNDKIKIKVYNLLKTAKQSSVELIIFPELSIPVELIEMLQSWSRENGISIIGGSHYHKKNNRYISRCPIFIRGDIFFTEKITPAPAEISPIEGEGLQKGNIILKLKNTEFGNVIVLICADYLNEDIKSQLDKNDIDILIVVAFQSQSEFYFKRMSVDCENSKDGIYILYSNFLEGKNGDGKSSIFAIMDKIFSQKLFEKGLTDLQPNNKLFQLNEEFEYVVFDINLDLKRPYVNRNIETEPNLYIRLLSEKIDSKNLDFLKKISHDDERYSKINHYYVPPKEYKEILDSLEKNNIVFIIGDAGIGKTYTAVKILRDYYETGFEPIWFVGLDKEDRDIQSRVLSSYIPQDNQIVYFEDPFGKTVFERRDSLFQIFTPLLDKLSQYNSRIIITSRKEVFERFSQESLLEKEILDLKSELNIRKPSYDKKKLKEIFTKLAEIHCEWFEDKKMTQIVFDAIDTKKITTPLSIRDMVFSSKKKISEIDLINKIHNREKEIINAFALEILGLSIPAKVTLYIVFFIGGLGYSFIYEMFDLILNNLRNIGLKFAASYLNIELRSQLGYRIEQVGFKKTAYKFAHPVYEESLAKLILTDAESEIIAKNIIQELIVKSTKTTYSILSKYVAKYPDMALLLYKYAKDVKQETPNEELSVKMSQRLITIGRPEFFNLATEFYPLRKLIDNLNNESQDPNILGIKLNLVERYKYNSPLGFDASYINRLNWKKITKDLIYKYPASKLLYIISICKSINDNYIDIFCNLSPHNYLKQIYYMLDNNDRKRMEEFLLDANIYNDIILFKKTIVSQETGTKRSPMLYKKILFSECRYYGTVYVDSGAANKLMRWWSNLLPIGVIGVEGEFEAGIVVAIKTKTGKIIGAGISEYNSHDLHLIKGLHSWEIQDVLGFFHTSSVILSKYRIVIKNKYSFSWKQGR